MAFTVTQGPVVTGTGTTFGVTLPPKQAGDYIQIIVVTSATATPASAGYDKPVDVAGVVEVFQKAVASTSTTTANANVDLSASTSYTAWAQILHTDPLEPSLPTLTATVVEGDGKVTVNWVPSDPAAFASYVAKLIAPAAAAQQTGTLSASARQAVFTGLTNGVEHTFRVEGTTV